MRISARCDYACKALLELSLHWPAEDPLQIQIISDRQQIPMRYLIQILIQLKRIGFVNSVRGKEGGYILAKKPKEIRLGEVLRAVGGELVPVADSVFKKGSVFTSIWKETEVAISKTLDSITFFDILEKSRNESKVLFYQI